MNAITEFEEQGFTIIEGVLDRLEAKRIGKALDAILPDGAGTRGVLPTPVAQSVIARLRTHPVVKQFLQADTVAVQCTLFEKSAARNWLVAPHQDLSIPVKARMEHAQLRGWSSKEGSCFVQPPGDLLAQMTAVRVHLDECQEEQGPLRVIPGSHRAGILAPTEISTLTSRLEMPCCTAGIGSVLLMKPLLVHASSKAKLPSRRRVLHYLFGPPHLPFGLEWADAS